MTWDAIQDQTGAVRLLRAAIAADRVGSAYLFVGPPSVGKALTALTFAQALNCAEGMGAACGVCQACRTTASHNHPDLLWARPEKRSRTISAETARNATRTLALAPQTGRYRVAVFDEADRLHTTAQNALLKTLEEPAPRSLIVLCTDVPAELLPTVRSRCQLVRFRPLQAATVAALLEREGVPAAAAQTAAAAAQGGVATARTLADADRMGFITERIGQAVAGDSAGAATVHARDLDQLEKALEKLHTDDDIDPDLLSREQRQRLEQERVARVQREMAERVETDLRLLALAVRDGLAYQAGGAAAPCVLGAALPEFAAAPPERLRASLDGIDLGLRYVRQYIRRDRVLFDVYGTLGHVAEAAA